MRGDALWLAGGLFFLMGGIVIFSIGSGRQRLESANTWVHNRRLTEDLEEALEGSDKDDIEAKTQKLTEVSGELAQKMYAEQAEGEQCTRL